MNIHLSKSEMEKLAGDCDDVEAGFTSVAATVDKLAAAGLSGFKTQTAITDLNDRWPEKAKHGAGRWEYFAGAVRETKAEITGTDEEVAFRLPTDIPGIRN